MSWENVIGLWHIFLSVILHLSLEVQFPKIYKDGICSYLLLIYEHIFIYIFWPWSPYIPQSISKRNNPTRHVRSVLCLRDSITQNHIKCDHGLIPKVGYLCILCSLLLHIYISCSATLSTYLSQKHKRVDACATLFWPGKLCMFINANQPTHDWCWAAFPALAKANPLLPPTLNWQRGLELER